MTEHCANPWNDKCAKTDIAVYIYFNNEMLPICRDCWKEISDSDLQW